MLRAVLLTTLVAGAASLAAQSALPGFSSQSGVSRAAEAQAAVAYLYPEQVTLAAGRPTEVALHFRVQPGLHINSHTPLDHDLIPTALTLPAGAGVQLGAIAYPKGERFALPVDPKTPLEVYTGEFVLRATLTAAAGDHLLEARLRYQACDNAACMPPKTLTVAIDVKGK